MSYHITIPPIAERVLDAEGLAVLHAVAELERMMIGATNNSVGHRMRGRTRERVNLTLNALDNAGLVMVHNGLGSYSNSAKLTAAGWAIVGSRPGWMVTA